MRGVLAGAALAGFAGVMALISWAIMGSVLPGLVVFVPAMIIGLLMSATVRS